MKTLTSFKDILVTCSADTLVIENSRLRREFDLSAGAPRTRSLRSADGTEERFLPGSFMRTPNSP